MLLILGLCDCTGNIYMKLVLCLGNIHGFVSNTHYYSIKAQKGNIS